MRRDLVLSSGFLLLLLILIVGAALMPSGGAYTIIGSAKFDPNRFDLTYGFGVAVVEATIRFEEEDVEDINASTILLEGSLAPSSTYLVSGGLVARFYALFVEYIIWGKIYHVGMLEPPYKVWLTITGNLKDTAGGTAFSATGYVKVIVPHSPEPP